MKKIVDLEIKIFPAADEIIDINAKYKQLMK
jgi:hypothetical protein